MTHSQSSIPDLFRYTPSSHDHSSIGMLTYRLDGDDLIFVSANEAADSILGANCSLFVGKTIEQAFPPLADTEIPERYSRAARDGTAWSSEHVDYDDGIIRGAYEVHAFQTAPMHMAVIFLDITARRQAELAQESIDNQIRDMQRLESLGVLAGGIANDFNNLLCGILGSAELIMMDMDASHPSRQDVATIQSSARKASDLWSELMA